MIRHLVFGLLCSMTFVSCDLHGMLGDKINFIEEDEVSFRLFDYVHVDCIRDGSEQAILDILRANPVEAARLRDIYMKMFVFEVSLYNRAYNPLVISMDFDTFNDDRYYENLANDAIAESLRLAPEYNALIDDLGIREHMNDVIDNCIERSLIMSGHEDAVRQILYNHPLEARLLKNLYMKSQRDNEGWLHRAMMDQHHYDYLTVITDGEWKTERRYDEVIRQIGLDAHLNRAWNN